MRAVHWLLRGDLVSDIFCGILCLSIEFASPWSILVFLTYVILGLDFIWLVGGIVACSEGSWVIMSFLVVVGAGCFPFGSNLIGLVIMVMSSLSSKRNLGFGAGVMTTGANLADTLFIVSP